MTIVTPDFYEVLGVSRDASAEEIRRAYRRLARRHHPDVSADAGSEERFKALSEAYEVLSDPEKRARYDRLGAAWDQPVQDGAGSASFDEEQLQDLFEHLFSARGAAGPGFGGPGADPFATAGTGAFGTFRGFGTAGMRGADHEAVLELSLEEAARGGRRTIALADGRSYDVEIPPGVLDGQLIRLALRGGAGAGGGPSGDLFLRVRLAPHPRFRLEGRDVHVELPVSPWEAALGATVEVPTLRGTAKVRVPAGSSTGRRLRLRGKGFPGPGGGRGDLYATLEVMVPQHLTPRERQLFEQLAAASDFDAREERR